MPWTRDRFPHLADRLFLTDGGIETTLIFHEGFDLPEFAAFNLLRSREGRAALDAYFRQYAEMALRHRVGLVLESPTWRASHDWGVKIGTSDEELRKANHQAIALLRTLRDELETDSTPMAISGCVGPRGDGYDGKVRRSAEEAERYHREQISTLREAGVDMITAITMTHVEEAIGVTRAARSFGFPVAISFTVETDGRLPSGQSLRGAIEEVDLATSHGPAYYMINCAHPEHFEHLFSEDAAWAYRIGGLRANASRCSHAELDEAEELDAGNPAELGEDYRRLRDLLPNLRVVGGCCGTDHRHVEAIARSLGPDALLESRIPEAIEAG